MTNSWSENVPCKDLRHVAEHVVTDSLGSRSIHFAMGGDHAGQRRHREPKQCGKDTNFQHHDNQGLGRRPRYIRLVGCASRIELHDTGGIRNRLDAGKRKDDGHKTVPIMQESPVQRLGMSHRVTQMWYRKETEQHDDDCCRQGDEGGDATRVLGAEVVQGTDQKNRSSRKVFGMGHTEVEKCRERADSGRHDVVRDQEKRPDNRDNLGAMADAGVDTTAVGIVPANRDVVVAHQRGEQTHGADQPWGAVTGYRKG